MSDFNSVAEVMQWLLDGNKVTTNAQLMYLDNGSIISESCVAAGTGHVQFNGIISNHVEYSKFVGTKWYDNIPDHGLLCWVWDEYIQLRRVRLVHSFKDDVFRGNYDSVKWKNAEPMTITDILKFTYDPDEVLANV